MEYYTVEEATEKIFTKLTESTGWKFLKSQRSLKKTLKDLNFEILFFSSKWNTSGQSVEINAEFRVSYKKFGKLPVENIIAQVIYQPKDAYWYDISTEEKLSAVYEELNDRIQCTAVNLYNEFEKDYKTAAEKLLNEYFDEYNVHLDFIAEVLGQNAVQEKAQKIYDELSAEMKLEVKDYMSGDRSKKWMINRNNLKYIIDNGLEIHKDV
jgi:hypothetical protein